MLEAWVPSRKSLNRAGSAGPHLPLECGVEPVSVAALIACLVLRSATAGRTSTSRRPDPRRRRVLRPGTPRSPGPPRGRRRRQPFGQQGQPHRPVRPIAAATRADAPPSGINPILVNANRKYALSEASTMSAEIASDTPTPPPGPARRTLPALAVPRSRGRRGSPREHVGRGAACPGWRGRPRCRTGTETATCTTEADHLTLASVAARSSVVPMVASIGAVSELRLSGRFSVTDNTPSLSDTVRSSIPV